MNVNVGIVVVIVMLVSFPRTESVKFYLTYHSDKIHCVCGQIRFDKRPTTKTSAHTPIPMLRVTGTILNLRFVCFMAE